MTEKKFVKTLFAYGKLRRLVQRTFRKKYLQLAKEVAADHTAANMLLCNVVRDIKRRCWNELRDEINKDFWEMGHQIMTQRLGTLIQGPSVEEMIRRIVDTLFTLEELEHTAKSMKNRKLPKPDKIPTIIRRKSDFLFEMYNQCLLEAKFCKRWKHARLVLVSQVIGYCI